MQKEIKKIIILSAVFLSLSFIPAVRALEMSLPENISADGSLELTPAKIEIFLKPGEEATRELKLLNKTGRDLRILAEKEDFSGDIDSPTKLLGEEEGSFSLKNYLRPETEEFILSRGAQAVLPVVLSLPPDAEPGGRYGALIFRAEEINESAPAAPEMVRPISRLAALFFVRVEGEVKEEGNLKSFSLRRKIFLSPAQVDFSLIYENKGNVHLNPYGVLEIKNIFSGKTDEVKIDPFFVMPGFTREFKAPAGEKCFGFYSAHLIITPGYGGIEEERTVYFAVLPIVLLAAVGGVIILFLLLTGWRIMRKGKK